MNIKQALKEKNKLAKKITDLMDRTNRYNSVDEILKMAEGKSNLNSNTEREGLVIRSMDTTISFKAISNKFLLKNS